MKFKRIQGKYCTYIIPDISGKKYLIHDNGDRPYLIIIGRDKTIWIITYKDTDDYSTFIYDNLLFKIQKYEKVFIPKDPEYEFTGNSILIKLNPHEYIYVGDGIYKFKTKDEIVKYFSPVGNSDVPYPWAKGTEFTYFMLDATYMSNSLIPDNKKIVETYGGSCIPADVYCFYYDTTGKKGKLKDKVKRLRIKTLDKRRSGPTSRNRGN